MWCCTHPAFPDHARRAPNSGNKVHSRLLLRADFDQKFPGFETDIHGLRSNPVQKEGYLTTGVDGAGNDTARHQGANGRGAVPQG
jgi:hypothetical protein